MPTSARPQNGALGGSLHGRRQRLFELHSFLRSVDNLRPDEALDEIAKLFEVWARFRSFEVAVPDAKSALSEQAASGAITRLSSMLADVEPGHGADLFQELADVGVRAGMGQYFTPLPVAEAIAVFLAPMAGETWLDPFCGSGLLLGALTTNTEGDLRLFGVDRDQRVLHLARVEAMLHHPSSEPGLLLANALEEPASLLSRLGAPRDGVDGIVTNPPFGSEVHEADRGGYAEFELGVKSRVPLEILGLEQSIRLLRPGGRLGIVLPQSILSNRSLAYVRKFVLDRCCVDGILGLPGETFLPFKGVSKASVLFLTKRVATPHTAIRIGVSLSVGWDANGRAKGKSDAAETARRMKTEAIETARLMTIEQAPALSRNLSAEWLLRPRVEGRPLSDLCSAIFTGASPGRAAYDTGLTDAGAYRVLKVGDLTNHGIDWSVGERSLASLSRRPTEGRLLRIGDLATTAAAHHPRYIAAKVDYVDCFPTGFEDRCIAVAEVLVFRPCPSQIDPLALLLWLRSDEGREALQSCVTGQTAHLSANDVSEVVVPHRIFSADLTEAIESVRHSLRLRRESEVASARAARCFVDRSTPRDP